MAKEPLSIELDKTDASTKEMATFIFGGEDHTLGNALRYMLARKEDVAFAAYTVPHPSELRFSLRVQTTGAPVTEVVKDGLGDLAKLSETLSSAFDQANGAGRCRHNTRVAALASPRGPALTIAPRADDFEADQESRLPAE